MATIALVGTPTPYSAVYKLDGGSGANPGVLDFSNPPTLAALAAGPLKAEITRRLGHLDDLNLNVDSARVRVYFVTGIDENMYFAGPMNVYWTANHLEASIWAGGEGGHEGILFVEIRFEHSQER